MKLSQIAPALLAALFLLVAGPAFASGLQYEDSWTWRQIEGLYDYATGANGASCLTCGFFGYFSGALNLISQTVFMLFRGYALVLLPVIGGLYLLFQVGRELAAGDVKPTAFLMSKLKTIVAFSLVAVLISGAPIASFGTGNTTLHSIVGPLYLDKVFDLTAEIRGSIADRMAPAQENLITAPPGASYQVPADKTAMYQAATSYHQNETMELVKQGYSTAEAQRVGYERTVQQYPEYADIRAKLIQKQQLQQRMQDAYEAEYDPTLGCGDLNLSRVEDYVEAGVSVEGHRSGDIDMAFIRSSTSQSCFIERVHILGFSTGLSILTADAQFGDTTAVYGSYLIDAMIQIIMGFLFMFIFAMSAVYLIMLVLDIIVRGLVTAALSPALAMMWLFPSSRPLVGQAFMQLVGAIGTAIALAISGAVAITLFLQTVDVYNMHAQSVGPYADLQYLPIGPSLLGYKDFLAATHGVAVGVPRVPLTFSAPWTWYLLLSGLAIPSIAKAIIKIIESVLSTQNQDTLAQTALNTAKSSMALAQQSGQLFAMTSIAGSKAIGRHGGRALSDGWRAAFPGAGPDIDKVGGGAAQRMFDASTDLGLSDAPAVKDIVPGAKQ
ncbi:hypothetical protein [Tranquillimonas alkanivorans]|uniref:TrbL/VirB6 plasmid conjugal transfer protein n=1 Tax=Tranquillimonas alkanivorans TaxID=441119 RepID=A0A1I5V1K2_9RHOB|nr:hypothetical protein [Tranquillimonas alkanivorans]SFQ01358.1 hypothetical protein SAMN04488047_12617 [Tranquillimonas alkanivorans]